MSDFKDERSFQYSIPLFHDTSSVSPSGPEHQRWHPQGQILLHYSSVDDATCILSKLGKGAFLAKVDLKSAFRMVPVRSEDEAKL